eukprot:CAMPEP_0194123822 /NCGR_PEP_ID=MMETSP0150-20130528/56104_1 /TAXON_ID=122233 /ORGANISM="Chaetoceros debilis, Strain MM31A-1" /LENGTH=241 /DNA_ID=CAMNT_0038817247 /DNA_START=31 /DNA_END=753 /DNA_ORIENTATION=-
MIAFTSASKSVRSCRDVQLFTSSISTRSAHSKRKMSEIILMRSQLSSQHYSTALNLQNNDIGLQSLSEPDVLSNSDLFSGTIIAFLLAFLFSFLNGRTPSSSNIKLWRSARNPQNEFKTGDLGSSVTTDEDDNGNMKKFDGDAWKEISRPENYALYTNKLRKNVKQDQVENKSESKSTTSMENKLVLISLLVLFVPIFSVELFFALSRQFICGDYVTQVDDNLWLTDSTKALSASNGLSPW